MISLLSAYYYLSINISIRIEIILFQLLKSSVNLYVNPLHFILVHKKVIFICVILIFNVMHDI